MHAVTNSRGEIGRTVPAPAGTRPEINAEKLLGTAAHELRSPLASIRGIAEFLRDGAGGPLTAVQQQLIGTIHDTSAWLLELAGELLDFTAALQAPRLRLELHDLRDLVATTVATANLDAVRKATRIQFQPGSEQVALIGDGCRLRQVIDNLLSNAIKYSPAGSVVTVLVENDPRLHVCRLRVRDQGPGIPLLERHRLFADFGRLSTKPTGGEKSTGLGLAICRRIVEAHHGTIDAENLPNGGAEFRVVLPSGCGVEVQDRTAAPELDDADFIGCPGLTLA